MPIRMLHLSVVLCLLVTACRLNETPQEVLERKCKKNDFTSCYNLGYAFREGQGAPIDLSRAKELFTKACDGLVTEACEHLGLMNERGIGTPANADKARQVYRFGCEHGGGGCCINLGLMVAEGRFITSQSNVVRLPSGLTVRRTWE